MRITVPSWQAPRCKCGQPTEIHLYAYNRELRVKNATIVGVNKALTLAAKFIH